MNDQPAPVVEDHLLSALRKIQELEAAETEPKFTNNEKFALRDLFVTAYISKAGLYKKCGYSSAEQLFVQMWEAITKIRTATKSNQSDSVIHGEKLSAIDRAIRAYPFKSVRNYLVGHLKFFALDLHDKWLKDNLKKPPDHLRGKEDTNQFRYPVETLEPCQTDGIASSPVAADLKAKALEGVESMRGESLKGLQLNAFDVLAGSALWMWAHEYPTNIWPLAASYQPSVERMKQLRITVNLVSQYLNVKRDKAASLTNDARAKFQKWMCGLDVKDDPVAKLSIMQFFLAEAVDHVWFPLVDEFGTPVNRIYFEMRVEDTLVLGEEIIKHNLPD